MKEKRNKQETKSVNRNKQTKEGKKEGKAEE